MKIPRLPEKYTRPLWIVAWSFAGFGNLAAVLVTGGNWVNLAFGTVFGALAVHGYRQRVRDREDAEASRRRGADIAWWHSALNSSVIGERKAAVDLLSYWGQHVTVDPLQEPSGRRRLPAPDRDGGPVVSQVARRDAAGLDPAEVRARAAQLATSGYDLSGVVTLRENHERTPCASSPLWIAACKLLEEKVAEQAGYEQDVDEITLRNFAGSVCLTRSEPVGPTPREQMLAELERQARAVRADARARTPQVAGRISRDLPRSYLMSQKIHDRR